MAQVIEHFGGTGFLLDQGDAHAGLAPRGGRHARKHALGSSGFFLVEQPLEPRLMRARAELVAIRLYQALLFIFVEVALLPGALNRRLLRGGIPHAAACAGHHPAPGNRRKIGAEAGHRRALRALEQGGCFGTQAYGFFLWPAGVIVQKRNPLGKAKARGIRRAQRLPTRIGGVNRLRLGAESAQQHPTKNGQPTPHCV